MTVDLSGTMMLALTKVAMRLRRRVPIRGLKLWVERVHANVIANFERLDVTSR